MASDNNEASCENDPNFAVICAFMEKFGTTCGLASIDFLELQEMLENTQEVSQELIDLHIKLLRKSRKSVSNERWERAIIKFCHTFCVQDAWEIERFGYKKARLSSKLRILKELLEMQFDYNTKFKTEINKMSADELRSQPLGKDKYGHLYWYQNDNNYQIRIYKEDPDEETWTLVAKDRDGLLNLINELNDGDSKISSDTTINEDSNSLVEKPIIDTGQIESSNSSDSKQKTDESEENSNDEKQFDNNIKLNKRQLDDDDDDDGGGGDIINKGVCKKIKIDNELSETVEEPVMLIKGDGLGCENECVNSLIVSETIEEPVMYIYGVGNGVDCQTGNDNKSNNGDNNTQLSKTCNNNSNNDNNSEIDTSNSNSVSINKTTSDFDTNSIDNSKDTIDNRGAISSVKNPYKLGTIIDTKTDNNKINSIKSPVKKSRWDVETITTTITTTTTTESEPKKPIFFFGPNCSPFKTNLNPVSCSATIGFGQKVPQLTPEIDNKDDKITTSEHLYIEENTTIIKDEEIQDSKQIQPIEDEFIDQRDSKDGNILNESNLEITKEDRKISTNKSEEMNENSNENQINSTISKSIKNKEDLLLESEQIPVEEPKCIKKFAYTLGDEDNLENHSVVNEKDTEINKSSSIEMKQAKDNEIEEPECIKKFAYTVGHEDTADFNEKNLEINKSHMEMKQAEDNEIEEPECIEKFAYTVGSDDETLKNSEIDKRDVEIEEKLKVIDHKNEEAVENSNEITEDLVINFSEIQIETANLKSEKIEEQIVEVEEAVETTKKNDVNLEIPIEEDVEETIEITKNSDVNLEIHVTENVEETIEITKQNEENLEVSSVVENIEEKPDTCSKIEKESPKIDGIVEISNEIDENLEKSSFLEKDVGEKPDNCSNIKPQIPKVEEIIEISTKIEENSSSNQENKEHTDICSNIEQTIPIVESIDISKKIEENLDKLSSITEKIEEKTDICSNIELQSSKVEKPVEIVEKIEDNQEKSPCVEIIEEKTDISSNINQQLPKVELKTVEITEKIEENLEKSVPIVENIRNNQNIVQQISKVDKMMPVTEKIEENLEKSSYNEDNVDTCSKIEQQMSKIEKIEENTEKIEENLEKSSSGEENVEEENDTCSKIEQMPKVQKIEEITEKIGEKLEKSSSNKENEEENDTCSKIEQQMPKVQKIEEITEKIGENLEESSSSKENEEENDTYSKIQQQMPKLEKIVEITKKIEENFVKSSTSKENVDDENDSCSKIEQQIPKFEESVEIPKNIEVTLVKSSVIVEKIVQKNDIEQVSKIEETIGVTKKIEENLEKSPNQETIKETDVYPSTKQHIFNVEETVKISKKAVEKSIIDENVKESDNKCLNFKQQIPEIENVDENSRKSSMDQILERNSDTSATVKQQIFKVESEEKSENLTLMQDDNHNKPEILENVDSKGENKILFTTDRNSSIVSKETDLVPVEMKTVLDEPKKSNEIEEITANISSNIQLETVITTKNDEDNVKIVDTKHKIEESVKEKHDEITVNNKCDENAIKLENEDIKIVKKNENNDELNQKIIETKPVLSLMNFSLDFTETPISTPLLTRTNLRKRGRENPEDNNEEIDNEETGGKRIKIRGKRNIDTQLRKSIEEQKNQNLISSDDDDDDNNDGACDVNDNDDDDNKTEIQDVVAVKPKKRPKRKGGKKKKKKAKSTNQKKTEDGQIVNENEAPGAIEESDTTKTKRFKNPANKNKRLLQNLGISLDLQPEIEMGPVGVRQSRRIAQLKIKEEAERRKLEEEMAEKAKEIQKKKKKKCDDKDYKGDKRKIKVSSDDEHAGGESDKTDKKKKKKHKKERDPRKLFDEYNPWKSSSGSSSSSEDDDDEIVEDEDYDEHLHYISDHEFSPESDLEGDGEAQPLKRARTVRKESEDEEEIDDCPCQKCKKSDHPEWILLCDQCDNGWHCSCLRPPLLVIPEGDWFCPPCQHARLLKNLQDKLVDYDKKLNKKEIEDRRKERLAYVGISLNNVLPAKETERIKKKRRKHSVDIDEPDIDDYNNDDDYDEDDDRYNNEDDYENVAEVDKDSSSDDDDDDDESGESETESESNSSDSDEPIYQLRQRRQAHSYRFNDYDELINSAIQDEMEAVKGAGNQGRGKDISTIVNAEKEDDECKKIEDPDQENCDEIREIPPESELPPLFTEETPETKILDVSGNNVDNKCDSINDDDDNDDDQIRPVKKRPVQRKKTRKLNALDISSADDEDSDEDFKGTSTDSDEDFDDEELGTEDSDDLDSGRGGRRRGSDIIRRSTRARTSRYDADFIDDDSEDDAPRRKKKKSIWDESESEESDRSWGRRKRKPTNRQKKTISTVSKKKKSKKKKKCDDDSDAEVYKKKKPKIKFGLDGEEMNPGRRTRGKKINYVDALGSDSDEDKVKRPPPRIESEEEYVANEEEELDEDDKVSEEDEAESSEELRVNKTKINIQSYADKSYTRPLPTPTKQSNKIQDDDLDDEPNPIDVINKNLEEMDENEMEKMMEEEEYANKQLQMVALQIEKEKKRKEREAKKIEAAQLQQSALSLVQTVPQQQQPQALIVPPTSIITTVPVITETITSSPKKRGRKPKGHFQFTQTIQDPIVGNMDSLIVNTENNEELSEPPGVSLPLFRELPNSNDSNVDDGKKRRGRTKKSIEEAVANLGSTNRQEIIQPVPVPPPITTSSSFAAIPKDLTINQENNRNIEIAAPPQPFSQSQPTPSVITRMLQNKPGQPGYPVGTIRPKQFATMTERGGGEEENVIPQTIHGSIPAHHTSVGTTFISGGIRAQLNSGPTSFRQLPPTLNHYPRSTPPPPSVSPHQIRNAIPQTIQSHIYHTHRTLDPSPSGGGAINMTGHNSPNRVASPASAASPSSSSSTGKNETPPPPQSQSPLQYTRTTVVPPPPPPPINRFPLSTRHMQHLVAAHLQPPRPNISPYHPNIPPSYYSGFPPPPPPPPSSLPPLPPPTTTTTVVTTQQQQQQNEDALPPTVYQPSQYSEQYTNDNHTINPSENSNSNSKSFDEESGGEFGGLVSYFSSQREDDLES